jgi:sialic acid synthase SpsE
MGTEIAIAAAALGAVMIEKHFTLSRTLQGPDQRTSLEPKEFTQMVRGIRLAEKAQGSGVKAPTKGEEKMRFIARRSIVSSVDIPEGQLINENMVDFKRPGTGIPPKDVRLLLGKRAARNIRRDEARPHDRGDWNAPVARLRVHCQTNQERRISSLQDDSIPIARRHGSRNASIILKVTRSPDRSP